ncbi:MAG: site-specific DNA-methyltransferase [Promethearchaeota archaeon]|jgi:adenine-specific DNA-methyltransferase
MVFETRENFVNMFLEIFQFDNLNLEFGIYKILNIKRQQIQNLINDLIPLILVEENSNDLFQYLLEFFSNYYDKGLLQNNRNPKELFSGEDIFLSWANQNQYYVQSLECSQVSGKKYTQDYFIHKNLKEFLESKLDFFMKKDVLAVEDISRLEPADLKVYIKTIKKFKEFACRIIDRLNQIEIFQLRLWNKKKYILKTDYVITLDKIEEYAGINFIEKIEEKILSNKEQLKEWSEILKTQITDETDLIENQSKTGNKLKSLPLDTKYFDEVFKWDLISALTQNNNLDKILDGVLIKGDNFQALNLIMKKWGENVNLIFIDPPFNTGKKEILYKNDFLDSTWLVIMYNRLIQAKEILNKKGSIFVRIDNNGNHYTRFLLDTVFGKSNFRNEIIINKTRAKQQRKKPFIQQTESLFFYSVTDDYFFNQVELPRKEPRWYELLDFPRSNQIPRKILGKKYYPPRNRRWGLSQERIDEFVIKGKVRINKDKSYIDCLGNTINEKPELFYDVEPVRNNWLDIPGYSQVHKFSTENSEELLQRVIESGSKEGDLVLDFFLGSGTTIATAHKLNRKWIGVEMGNQFEDFILPRMKNVLKGEKSGISKTLDSKKAGFFKYHYLEQFEDSIENTVSDLSKNKEDLHLDKIKDPIQYQLKAVEDKKSKPFNVDLIETFNYLIGIFVEKMIRIKTNGREYIIISGKVDKVQVGIIWRAINDIDLEFDKKFIEESLNDDRVDVLFVNGSCLIENARSIEAELDHLIFS